MDDNKQRYRADSAGAKEDVTRQTRRWRMLLAVTTIMLAGGGARADERGNERGGRDDDRFEHRGHEPYSIGLWGDLPYSGEQLIVGIPALVADMNMHRLAFTVHDGDIKSGSNRCADIVYTNALAFFNSLDAPAAFTPGDNDWTDCDRESAGAFSSRERLDFVRSLLFPTSFTLGKHRLRQEVQTARLCLGVDGPVPCVENRRWSRGGVIFATLNVQGSCNNLCDTAPDPDEFAARNHANIVWLQETFAEAARRGAVAVMLISQADPGWDMTDTTRAPGRDPLTLAEAGSPDGYQEFLVALRTEVVAFRRPVAYVHGDSHYLRIDKPFLDAEGRRLENFTRVETFGDHQENHTNDVNWLMVTVDPRSREVFSYQPKIVPENRVAVPAP